MLNFWLPETARESWASPGELGIGHAEEFAAALRRYNPDAELRFIKRRAEHVPPDWRGRWAIVVPNGGGVPPSVFIIQTPQGDYADPGMEHLAALMAKDAERNTGAWRRERERTAKRLEAGRKAREEKRREFCETLAERLNHLYDPRIAVTATMKERLEKSQVQTAIGTTVQMVPAGEVEDGEPDDG